MNTRVKCIIKLSLVLAITGCSSADDKPRYQQAERPSPGDERTRGDWHCVVDQDRLWNCRSRTQQASPPSGSPAVAEEPAPVLELPSETPTATPAGPPVETTPVVESGPTEKPALTPAVTSTESPESSEHERYALQLGAFRNLETANSFRESLQGVEGEVLRTTGDQGDWYIVLGGTYPDPASARTAASELLEANPGLEYWVRESANLAEH